MEKSGYDGKLAKQEADPSPALSWDTGIKGVKDLYQDGDKMAREEKANKTVRPCLKRHLILFLYCLNAANKAYQWIQISVSTDKLSYYYQVDNYVINSTSITFLASFIILSFPACVLIKLIGLRKSVIMGSFGTAVGSIIKCFGLADLYGIKVLFVGQILVSLSEQFIFSIPNRLVSVWYPDHQLSTALSSCVMGQMVGVALGFLLPQYILSDAETMDEIGHGLNLMFVGTAIISVVSFVADLIFFDEAPEHPPSVARLKQMEEESLDATDLDSEQGIWRTFGAELYQVRKQLGRLLCNWNLVKFNIIYSASMGICYTIQTLLNQILQHEWSGDSILVGYTGLSIILAGCVGTPLIGYLLDQSHRYLLVNKLSTFGSGVSIIAFAWAVSSSQSKLAVYLTACALGFFQIALNISSLELSVELTYPAPELVTSTFMNFTPQIFGILICFIGSFVVDTYGTVAVCLLFLAIQMFALILLLFIRETLKRQAASNERVKTPKALVV